MPSINLLPKNLAGFKNGKNNNVIFAVSFLLVFASVALALYFYVDIQLISRQSEAIDHKISETDKTLKKEFFDNKLLAAEKKIDDANSILNNHRYFSKIFKIMQNSLIDEIYLESLDVELKGDTGLTLNFEGVGKNILSVASQMDIFRKSEFVKKMSVKSISTDEDGNTTFGMDLIIKEKEILY